MTHRWLKGALGLLALGLADAVALRPALADRVLLGEAAIFPLLREPL